MSTNWNLQWRNHNSQRSYPLTEWATSEDLTATVRIPDTFLTGMELPIHAGLDVEPDKFYLKSLSISPVGITLFFGYWNGTTNPTVASASLVPDLHTENRAYPIIGLGDFSDTVGSLIVGTLDEINQVSPGTYNFDLTGGALDVDAVRPYIRGVSSLVVVNGSDRSPRLIGDAELEAGTNFRIDVEAVEGSTPRIIFNAITGDGLVEECVCVDEDQGPCVRYLNGVAAQPNGNVPIAGDSCITVLSTATGLELRDRCSKPCSGCDDLVPLVSQLQKFADGYVTLQNLVSKLSAEQGAMNLIVLSKTGGSTCIECG